MNLPYDRECKMFALAMEREMCANTHKAPHVPKLPISKLESELDQHVAKLKKLALAVDLDRESGNLSSDWLKNRLLEFAADVGNCAMFYAHAYDVLTLRQIGKRQMEPDMMEHRYANDEDRKKVDVATIEPDPQSYMGKDY